MSADVLTLVELQRLTFWKWRYTFETLGFSAAEADLLTFVIWLRRSGRC